MLKLVTLFNYSVSGGLGVLGLLACGACLVTLQSGSSAFLEWSLLSLGGLEIEISLILDPISCFFFASVAWIAASVFSFARSYMLGDRYYLRFTLLVLSFVGAMFLLIFSPNLMSILLGWDGLGVTSYLLVIYYQSAKSYNAGLLTALTNRLGDVGILLSIALLASSGSWNFGLVGTELPLAGGVTMLVMILAAMTKSAQIPFSAWLPAAMAAPTPVSALVHSSTLVTAGVYLLIRFNLTLTHSPWLGLLLFSGAITMLMAGASAMFETDMKKMVALSTLSQLGLMMSALGIGSPSVAFFHLLSHAYFKALLFMCAGNLIHCSNNYQDLRQMGGMYFSMPLTTSFMNLSNLSLCGFPFMAGFYSKDMFLEMSLLGTNNLVAVLLFFLATLLTAAYSVRFTLATSFREMQFSSLLWTSDEDATIVSGNWALFPLAVTGGSFLSWALFATPALVVLPTTLKTLAFLVSAGGIWFALNFNHGILPPFLRTTALMWNLPLISGRLPSAFGLPLGPFLRLTGDQGWFYSAYHLTPYGTGSAFSEYAQTKEVTQYSLLLSLAFCWTLLCLLLSCLWLYIRMLVLIF